MVTRSPPPLSDGELSEFCSRYNISDQERECILAVGRILFTRGVRVSWVGERKGLHVRHGRRVPRTYILTPSRSRITLRCMWRER